MDPDPEAGLFWGYYSHPPLLVIALRRRTLASRPDMNHDKECKKHRHDLHAYAVAEAIATRLHKYARQGWDAKEGRRGQQKRHGVLYVINRY